MTTDHKTNWEEEFEKILDEGWTGDGDRPNVDKLKTFIKQTLYTTLTDLISKLEKEKINRWSDKEAIGDNILRSMKKHPIVRKSDIAQDAYDIGIDKSKQIVEEFIRDLSK